MTSNRVFYDIDLYLYHYALVKYPWINAIPKTWPLIVHFFESFTSQVTCKPTNWQFPRKGAFKCNIDGSAKGNPGPAS